MSYHLYCSNCAERYAYPTDTTISYGSTLWSCSICSSQVDVLYRGEWVKGSMKAINGERDSPVATPIRESVQRRMKEWGSPE